MHSDAPEEHTSPIVVGHGGSAGSDEALRWAAEEAERRGDPLRLLCGVPRPSW
jgi:hypothetical protein